MTEGESIEELMTLTETLGTIKKNTNVQEAILSQIGTTKLIYYGILEELKKQTRLLEELKEAGRIVTVTQN